MKKTVILATNALRSTGTTYMDGTPCEWAFSEVDIAENSFGWGVNVNGYVQNIVDMIVEAGGEGYHIAGDDETFTIHNAPSDAVVVVDGEGTPMWAYWTEKQEFNDADIDTLLTWLKPMFDSDPRNCADIVHLLSIQGFNRDDIYRETGIDKDVIEGYIEKIKKDME